MIHRNLTKIRYKVLCPLCRNMSHAPDRLATKESPSGHLRASIARCSTRSSSHPFTASMAFWSRSISFDSLSMSASTPDRSAETLGGIDEERGAGGLGYRVSMSASTPGRSAESLGGVNMERGKWREGRVSFVHVGADARQTTCQL